MGDLTLLAAVVHGQASPGTVVSQEVEEMEISVAVPNGLMDVSNGRFVGKTDLGDGYTRWDWQVHYPINNYDVALNIGEYQHWSGVHANKDTGEQTTLSRAVSALPTISPSFAGTPIGSVTVADSTAISGSRARSAGQSRCKCGFANGSSVKNAPVQRTQDSVDGGKWPPA